MAQTISAMVRLGCLTTGGRAESPGGSSAAEASTRGGGCKMAGRVAKIRESGSEVGMFGFDFINLLFWVGKALKGSDREDLGRH